METTYYILLNMKTANGFESFGRFEIGNNREIAYNVFSQLKGNQEISEENILSLEFIETSEGLPLNLQMLRCTLDQISENCRILTKETFKRLNLPGI